MSCTCKIKAEDLYPVIQGLRQITQKERVRLVGGLNNVKVDGDTIIMTTNPHHANRLREIKHRADCALSAHYGRIVQITINEG